MALFHLVRHADHGLIGRALAGRMAGVGLGGAGPAQARRLARHFAEEGADAVYASPLERTVETARPIADACAVPLRTAEPLLEVDFGDWTGLSFAELDERAEWRRWNGARSQTRPPGGESMVEVQARACRFINDLADRSPEGRFVLVSHADVIRAVLAYYLGVAIDLFLRVEVSPASVSVLSMDGWTPRLLGINRTFAPDEPNGSAAP
jgi:probable phosphoglycerate mutase